MLKLAIEGQGHVVVEARDQGEAMRAMQQDRPALVLTDLRLPEGDGFGVLRAAKELDPELPVIVMTAYGSIQDAVAAMKEGALDFLAKPVDPDHLLLMVERALAQRRVMTEYILLKEELAARRGAPQIIGDAPSLKHVDSGAAARGRIGRHGAARRRERHRQGAVCAGAARAQPAIGRAVRRHQLRGDSRKPARNRAVRPREGRLHRRGGAQARQVRARASRHAVSRRDRRPAAGAAGQDSARARRAAVRARRRHAVAARRRAHRRGDQQGSCGPASRRSSSARICTSGCRCFPITIPPLRDRPGRHSDSGAPFRRAVLPRAEEERGDARAVGDRGAAEVSLARQRARAAELHGAGGHSVGERHHSRAAI